MPYVMIAGEDGPDRMVKMPAKDLKRARVLLIEYQDTGDWAQELNDIIDRSTPVDHVGTISTSGDGGGYYPFGDDE
jgi:hypothetical protein